MIVISRESPIDSFPESVRSRIERYLAWVWKSVPAYQNKASNWRPGHGLLSFPITYDYELADHPLSFRSPHGRSVRVCSSGGTLGRRKIIFRSSEDISRSNLATVGMFKCAGVSENDCVAILQPFDLWNIGHLALKALEDIGATTCPLGLSASNDFVLKLLEEIGCNKLYTSPSRAMQLIELSPDYALPELECVMCAGEPILPHHRQAILQKWGAATIGIYGSEETDGLGAECSLCCGYHIFSRDLLVEVLDPSTLNPASEKEGALCITLLDYSGTALVRYMLGDMVEIHRSSCRCGRNEPRIKMKGRIKDTVWLFDGNKLPLAALDHSLSAALKKSVDYQLVINHEDGVDLLEFHVVAPSISIDNDKIVETLIQSSQEMEMAYSYLQTLHVRIFNHSSRNELFITERGKTPRIVDRRKSPPGVQMP